MSVHIKFQGTALGFTTWASYFQDLVGAVLIAIVSTEHEQDKVSWSIFLALYVENCSTSAPYP